MKGAGTASSPAAEPSILQTGDKLSPPRSQTKNLANEEMSMMVLGCPLTEELQRGKPT